MLFLLTGSPQKLKLDKIHGTLIILFYLSTSSHHFERLFYFLSKTYKKNNHSSASDWWRNTKSSVKENARSFSKNHTTQENIKILRLKKDYKTYTKKKTSNQKLNQ